MVSLASCRLCRARSAYQHFSYNSWMSIIRTLAALHSLDAKKIGLGDFGSTAPFYPRQIRCAPFQRLLFLLTVADFSLRFHSSLSKVSKAQAAVRDKTTNAEVGPLPSIDFLLDWYKENAPNGGKREGSVIHGDFKCDNMVRGVFELFAAHLNESLTLQHLQIFHPTKPEVIGVLDWELSTLVRCLGCCSRAEQLGVL